MQQRAHERGVESSKTVDWPGQHGVDTRQCDGAQGELEADHQRHGGPVPCRAQARAGARDTQGPERRGGARSGAVDRPVAAARLRGRATPRASVGECGDGLSSTLNPFARHTRSRLHCTGSSPRRSPSPAPASSCRSTCTPSARAAQTRTLLPAASPRSSSPSTALDAACSCSVRCQPQTLGPRTWTLTPRVCVCVCVCVLRRHGQARWHRCVLLYGISSLPL